jgi:hypothetical protein
VAQQRKESSVNREEHLLTCLAEECAEVAQRVSKALRFGLDEVQPGQDLTNAQRISEELRDLVAVAHILGQEEILDPRLTLPGSGCVMMKRSKIERFMAISVEHGALASVDTHPQGGDPAQTGAPFMSGAVGEAETHNLSTPETQDGNPA